MKHSIAFLISSAISVCCVFSSCVRFGPDPEPAAVTYTIEKVNENRVIIYIEDVKEVRFDYQSQWTLMDVMDDAKVCAKLTYESAGGMVTSIEGKANAADFSSCWMLYTSDTEMANKQWGEITVEDKTLGSAIVGAESLTVLEGETYVWEYQTF